MFKYLSTLKEVCFGRIFGRYNLLCDQEFKYAVGVFSDAFLVLLNTVIYFEGRAELRSVSIVFCTLNELYQNAGKCFGPMS